MMRRDQVVEHFRNVRESPGAIYPKSDYLETHLERFKSSYLFIEHLLQEGAARVLELGEPGKFTRILSDLVPGLRITNTTGDLRRPFLQERTFDGLFDLVLCMELLEHVKDLEEPDFGRNIQFTGNGVLNILHECRRLLHPGGTLFISTPNVNGHHNFIKMAQGKHPFAYESHVREMAMCDVLAFLEKTGFRVKTAETKNVWFFYDQSVTAMIEEFCGKATGQEQDWGKGDCMFILAER
jgi:SAM-dependent methyltransferase